MMICLTIITIISMLISFFSLKISAENTQKTSKEWARDGYEESAEALDILMSNWVTERKDNE